MSGLLQPVLFLFILFQPLIGMVVRFRLGIIGALDASSTVSFAGDTSRLRHLHLTKGDTIRL